MSFHEMAITIRAVNRCSNEFNRIKTDAESMEAQIKSVGATFAGLGAASTAVAHLGHQFGLLTAEQARWLSSIGSVVMVLGMFMRTSWGVAIAQKVYAAACWIATAAQNALNISYATFLALTGVGIAVIIAAAAAMWHFASQMNAATASVKEYNTAMAETSGYGRSIRRAGEEEALRRRGVE